MFNNLRFLPVPAMLIAPTLLPAQQLFSTVGSSNGHPPVYPINLNEGTAVASRFRQ